MGSIRFSVTEWAAWSADRQTRRAWLDWAGAEEIATAQDDRESISPPSLLRRRVSQVGQKALQAAFSLPDVGASRFVLSSRHGEFGRTLTHLKALADGEPLSPADFSLSVHHALVGLLSIATKNRLGHTAVAAGRETFGYGLLEAAAAAAERPGSPVVLMHFDEPLPPEYLEIDEPQEPALALALSVACTVGDSGNLCLAMDPAAESEPPCGSLATEFLGFLLGGADERRAVGDRMRWHWKRSHGVA